MTHTLKAICSAKYQDGAPCKRQPDQPSKARCPQQREAGHRTISQRKASISGARSSLRLRVVQARANSLKQPGTNWKGGNGIVQVDSQDTWASDLSKEAVGKLLHTVPWTNSLTESNAAFCEHPGERPDEREQTKITQVDSQYTWVSTWERRPSARTRCSAGGPMRFVHLPGSGSENCLVLHPPESSPEPCVSRFSHIVDVHPPEFFALGLSLKTPSP
jgi:hypothetical protein